jgi:predicted nucleic acid-binding protein
MIFSEDDVIYCDANFLIAYGAKKVKQPELNKRALILFARILAGKSKLIASTLTFDEVWMGIKREIDPKSVKNRWRIRVDNLLQRVGLKLMNSGVENFSYAEVFDDLNSFTNKLLNHKKFSVIQFKDPGSGVRNALNNLNSSRLKPRDAFHLAFAKDNGANCFLTNDSDFGKNKDKIGIIIENF